MKVFMDFHGHNGFLLPYNKIYLTGENHCQTFMLNL